MILEMKQALDELKGGNIQGYSKVFEATYEEVYCRTFLIVQKEDRAADYMKGFYTELFGALEDAYDVSNPERWLWTKYYQRMRKQYHKLLNEQQKEDASQKHTGTLAEIPAALPLLHRIMLVMSFRDEFTVEEISKMFGLPEEKVSTELQKLEKLLPSLTKNQPESVAAYVATWSALLMGASKQIKSNGMNFDIVRLFQDAAANAGIVLEAEKKKEDDFEYFVADPDITPAKEEKKAAPAVEEEPEEDDDEDDDSEYEDDDDSEYEDDDDEDDEDDEEDDEDDDDGDDRYDWDLEDDGKKMVVVGIILALLIVAVVAFGVNRFMNRDTSAETPAQTEEEDEEGTLIIKGDDGEDNEESVETEEEETEEPEESEATEEEEPKEPETVTMKVSADSSRVRSEANTSSDIVTSVTQGEKVEVLSDTSEEWVQIRCIEQNNEEGYMMSQYLTAAE
jgi:DNA-directed RNA polymerase specialized sigma24 family protein